MRRAPDSAITGYDWDFDGDGTFDRSTTGPTTSFAFPAAGSYAPVVRANDFRGGGGVATSQPIAVTGPAGGGAGGRPTLTIPAMGAGARYGFRLACATSCRVTAKMTVSPSLARRLHLKHRTVGGLTRNLTGTRTLRMRLTKPLRNAARRAGLKRITVTVTVTASNAGGSTKRTRTVTIRL